MNVNPTCIETEINNLIANCCKKPFKNKDSILGLKETYNKLLQLRIKVMLQYPDFPGDTGTENIINLLHDIAHNQVASKKMEWAYDHYLDLFKFNAEELLSQVAEKLKRKEVIAL
ncbi:MAG: hypothetical protein ABI402_08325 [Ferruginibacter sp.]